MDNKYTAINITSSSQLLIKRLVQSVDNFFFFHDIKARQWIATNCVFQLENVYCVQCSVFSCLIIAHCNKVLKGAGLYYLI